MNLIEIKALEKLRKYTLCDKGERFTAYINADELADEIQAEVDSRFMELPVDADGVPIHLYDKLLKSTGAAKPTYGEVVGISDDSVFFNAKQGWEANWSKLTRHVKPRTIEDVLEEFGNEFTRVVESPNPKIGFGNEIIGEEEPSEIIAKYADELRELMEVDT